MTKKTTNKLRLCISTKIFFKEKCWCLYNEKYCTFIYKYIVLKIVTDLLLCNKNLI